MLSSAWAIHVVMQWWCLVAVCKEGLKGKDGTAYTTCTGRCVLLRFTQLAHSHGVLSLSCIVSQACLPPTVVQYYSLKQPTAPADHSLVTRIRDACVFCVAGGPRSPAQTLCRCQQCSHRININHHPGHLCPAGAFRQGPSARMQAGSASILHPCAHVITTSPPTLSLQVPPGAPLLFLPVLQRVLELPVQAEKPPTHRSNAPLNQVGPQVDLFTY